MTSHLSREESASQVEGQADAVLARKTRKKFMIRRWLGELYVGKRIKMRHLNRLIRRVDLPKNARLLEVGSEDGIFCEWLSRKFPHALVDGLELNASQALACNQWAQQAGRGERIRFRQGNVLDLADLAVYDLVICLDVLGYIADDRMALRQMAAALKPGGWIIIHQPNTTYQQFDGTMHFVPPERAGEITIGGVRHGYAPDEMRALIASEPALHLEQLVHLNGRTSDLAHQVYTRLERPAVLRFLALPIIDLLSAIDRALSVKHGNTLCVIARKVTA